MDKWLTITLGDARTRVAIWLAVLAGTTMAIKVVTENELLPVAVDRVQRQQAVLNLLRNGMGMGLSISRAIVIVHSGHLDFYNNDSGGATFFFTLPAVER